ncbi:S41 family peptidase, partial [Candidatus Azambacteria bacterium]|nr:S41 family peptidase [Candidatus Azambacteria bacterium]
VEGADFSVFWETWHKIEQKYVGRSKLDKQAMVYGAVEGMVKSLKDPYTSFFEPESAKIFKEDVNGSFSGIGAEIGFRKGLLSIVSPLKDSPAEKAGVKAGDVILKIDKKETTDMSLEEAVAHIRGEKGTDVVLTVAREGSSEPKEIKIKRDTIKVPTITSEIKDGNIGYIKLYNFTGDATNEFANTARTLLAKGAERFVIDLRNNPGGFLDSAIDISSMVVQKGDIITIEDFGNGKGKQEYRSKGYGLLENIPIVVLINNGSASASEIFAGAIKGKNKVKVLGEKSFGKGSVQEVVDITDNTFLKVTIAKWLTPDGSSIQDGGITPDIEVLKPKDEDPKKDIQLEKAMETVKSIK